MFHVATIAAKQTSENNMYRREAGGCFFCVTDAPLQPITARRPVEHDRKYAKLPRGAFIYGQAEASRRHFVAELLSGVLRGECIVNSSGGKLDCHNTPPSARWKRPSTRLTTGEVRNNVTLS